MVTDSVMANSWNSRPTTSPMNSSGISTAISDTVRLMMVKPICSEPFNAAASGASPASTKRETFSIMTMASSTTNPVEMVSAISDRLSRLNPSKYMIASVPTKDSGTDRLGMIVAGRLRRNRKITSTTSTMARPSSNSTSVTEARIVVVRSVSTATFTAAGMVDVSCGSSALMLSTTWMTLAPGWRWMFRITAGVRFAQAPSLVFSAPLTTVATSFSRTGLPLR